MQTQIVRQEIPAALLTICPGYTGPVPSSEGQMAEAARADRAAKDCANGKILAIGKSVGAQ